MLQSVSAEAGGVIDGQEPYDGGRVLVGPAMRGRCLPGATVMERETERQNDYGRMICGAGDEWSLRRSALRASEAEARQKRCTLIFLLRSHRALHWQGHLADFAQLGSNHGR
jgi:hypothetical protein